MADAYTEWRSRDGKSVMKTIRTIWPELAAALDAGSGMGVSSEQRRATRPDCQLCGPHCAGKAAGKLRLGGRLVCLPCWGGRGEFIRNPEWTFARNPRPKREEWS